ncbi:hypothetical protein [Streptomyces sp. NPDC006285]|uniref:hypothetical protein n=1 Tax=Streptomyces sp. NPDC006285 TaxID=3364742 RepID=UPI0036B62696
MSRTTAGEGRSAVMGEAGTALTAVLVLLPERRPAERLRRHRDIRRLDLPYDVDSVETSGRVLRAWYEGWPVSYAVLDRMAEAAVRLALDPHDV